MMVAVPAVLVIERHQEQVGPLDRIEHAAGLRRSVPATTSHNGADNRSNIDVFNRNSRTPGFLAVEHLFDQVIENIAVAAGEGGDKRRRILVPAQEIAAICKPAIQPSAREFRVLTSSASVAPRRTFQEFPGFRTEKRRCSMRSSPS